MFIIHNFYSYLIFPLYKGGPPAGGEGYFKK